MKLTSFRDKDRTHLRDLIDVGLLDATWPARFPPELAARLQGVKYQYEQAAAFQSTVGEVAGYNLAETILCVLVVLLVAEQIFAWSASYHPAERRGRAQGGAA